ncbi:MAG: M10 family metallopeptidase C-terminal domain-containing protein [Caulobacter sp.]|nr:M10 family metallopeptidase C-terminal domain-containing protein [Caulobacter sp.]
MLNGNSAADTLTGGDGADTLFGGGGADVFVATAGGGADTVNDFVVGTDKIDVSAFGSIVGVTQQGSDALVTVASGVTFLLLGVSAASVTNASFIGLVAPTWNEIVGTSAAETINGTADADHIQGLDGVDRLFGLGGDDWLQGGAGNDVIVGGAGADLLEGGAGSDTFRYDSAADFNVGGALDRILDFGTGDRINLSAIDANTGVAGDQAFTVVGGFTSVAGQLMTSYDAGEDETLVQMDVNGDGVADYALIVEGNATLAWVL